MKSGLPTIEFSLEWMLGKKYCFIIAWHKFQWLSWGKCNVIFFL